ncbi:hypothetical protein MPSEU_000872900 [Mayamaea pseudoterrestris]|nr:hypothetical protein MPSEU_000872900 [Mayamaea pseudoterrestris]
MQESADLLNIDMNASHLFDSHSWLGNDDHDSFVKSVFDEIAPPSNDNDVPSWLIGSVSETSSSSKKSSHPSPFTDDSERSSKKLKCQQQSTVAASSLHSLCCSGKASVDDIREQLRIDPTAAARPRSIAKTIKSYDPVSGKIVTKQTCENYKYPLNLAIRHKLDLAIIKLLLEAEPHVSHLLDGHQKETSLHVMLKYSPQFVKGIDTLLLHHPPPISPLDRHQNNLLHVACRYGAPIDVLRHLVIIYPEALQQRNFLSELPVQVAQRNLVMCSTQVANFVWQQTNKKLRKV